MGAPVGEGAGDDGALGALGAIGGAAFVPLLARVVVVDFSGEAALGTADGGVDADGADGADGATAPDALAFAPAAVVDAIVLEADDASPIVVSVAAVFFAPIIA